MIYLFLLSSDARSLLLRGRDPQTGRPTFRTFPAHHQGAQQMQHSSHFLVIYIQKKGLQHLLSPPKPIQPMNNFFLSLFNRWYGFLLGHPPPAGRGFPTSLLGLYDIFYPSKLIVGRLSDPLLCVRPGCPKILFQTVNFGFQTCLLYVNQIQGFPNLI